MTLIEAIPKSVTSQDYAGTMKTVPLWQRVAMFVGLGGGFIALAYFGNRHSERSLRREYGYMEK